jgi:RNA recognition motif-containing protein
VSKLGPSIANDDDLAAVFKDIGPIVSSKLQKEIKGRPKGWGIVRFQSAADAKTAIETMNGAKIGGSNVPLEIRYDRK